MLGRKGRDGRKTKMRVIKEWEGEERERGGDGEIGSGIKKRRKKRRWRKK